MKTILSILGIALISTVGLQAQVQTDVQKKTTTKKVRVTDDNKIATKVVEETDAEIDVIEVEGTNELNQQATVIKKNADKVEVVGEDSADNVTNKVMAQQKRNAVVMDLEASKRMQMEKAAQERKMYEQKMAQMKAEMEMRRMELEKRPKGIVKLRDPDGDGIQ